MKDGVVVFDFDKTLTYRDTTLSFYKYCARKNRRKYILLFTIGWYFRAILVKLGLLSNLAIKNFGIRCFMSGLKRAEVEAYGKAYADEIVTNRIFREVLPQYPQAWIVSASPVDYLQPLFPSRRVIGSQLAYGKDGMVSHLADNCYGDRKRTLLRELGVMKIEELYTDSFSDQPLMDMAETTWLVKGDNYSRLSMLPL